MSINKVRRRRVTGPLWYQYDMEVLQVLLARLRRCKSHGIRPLGGKYPPSARYSS